MKMNGSRRTSWILATGMLAAMMLTANEAVVVARADKEQLYLAYNVWYEHRGMIYSANYKKGDFVPAGTAVKRITRTSDHVRFKDSASGRKYYIHFVQRHHPGRQYQTIYNRLLTTKNFDALTAGFSEEDLGAIRDGTIRVGMAKAAVLVSQGYPPESKTPALSSRVWKYWRSRFDTFDVYFDDDGFVSKIVD